MQATQNERGINQDAQSERAGPRTADQTTSSKGHFEISFFYLVQVRTNEALARLITLVMQEQMKRRVEVEMAARMEEVQHCSVCLDQKLHFGLRAHVLHAVRHSNVSMPLCDSPIASRVLAFV